MGYNVWPYAWHGFFYHCIAVALVLLFWELIGAGLWARLGLWFAVNNLLDELFFDPTKIAINEYIFAIIITTFETWQATRKKINFGSK
jgi:hypothetical protein